jgi:flagellar hook-basal body complex protein FliE
MSIFRPELNFNNQPYLQLRTTHRNHIGVGQAEFLNLGSKVSETGNKIGADAVIRSGTFGEALLGALDKVSAYQQFSSGLNQSALLDPDSVNVEDVSMAMAQASMSLNISRNVLNRVVQGWRDLINTR